MESVLLMRAKGPGSILDCAMRFAADFALAAGPSHGGGEDRPDRTGPDRTGPVRKLDPWCQFCESPKVLLAF